jgi:NodT family efflux transporter outer membrane factor (OMF) lipoprotein
MGTPKVLRLALPAAVLLAACAVGPDFHRPPAPAASGYGAGADASATVPAEGVAQTFAADRALPARWWEMFQSPQLDRAVQEALDGNPGLDAARASLRQSQYQLKAGSGVFFPAVDAGFGATREKSLPATIGEQVPGGIFDLFTLSASASYALDVFGGERRQVESLRAQMDARRNEVRAAYLALTANVANTVIARAAYAAEAAATQHIVDTRREQLRLARVQAQAGTIAYSNVLSLESALAATEAALPALVQKQRQADDLLATLAGHTPAQWQAPPVAFDALAVPAALPLSVPSDFVHQRPDILAAESGLHAASAEVGVATADLFPKVTLTGTYGRGGNASGDLLKNSGRFWSVGADVTAPLFEGGTLWYGRKAAVEGYRQSLAEYRQTVLSGFAQVADTLGALQHDAEILAAEERSRNAAEQALQLVNTNFKAGTAAYSDVLIADAQFQQARIAELQAQAARLQDTVALYTALGGGWWDAQDAAVAGKAANQGHGQR